MGKENVTEKKKDIGWNELSLIYPNPYTNVN